MSDEEDGKELQLSTFVVGQTFSSGRGSKGGGGVLGAVEENVVERSGEGVVGDEDGSELAASSYGKGGSLSPQTLQSEARRVQEILLEGGEGEREGKDGVGERQPESILDPMLLERDPAVDEISELGEFVTGEEGGFASPGAYFGGRSERLDFPVWSDGENAISVESAEPYVERRQDTVALQVGKDPAVMVPRWLSEVGIMLSASKKRCEFSVRNLASTITTVRFGLEDDADMVCSLGLSHVELLPDETFIAEVFFTDDHATVYQDRDLSLVLSVLTADSMASFSFGLSIVGLERPPHESWPFRLSEPMNAVDFTAEPRLVCFGGVQQGPNSASIIRRIKLQNGGNSTRRVRANCVETGGDASDFFLIDGDEYLTLGPGEERNIYIHAKVPDHTEIRSITSAMVVEEDRNVLCSVPLDCYVGSARLELQSCQWTDVEGKDKSGVGTVCELTLSNSGSRSAYIVPSLLGSANADVGGVDVGRGLVLAGGLSVDVRIRFKDPATLVSMPEFALHWGDEILRRRRRMCRQHKERDRFDADLYGETADHDSAEALGERSEALLEEDVIVFAKQRQVLLVSRPKRRLSTPHMSAISSRLSTSMLKTSTGVLSFPVTSAGTSSSCVLWVSNRSTKELKWWIEELPRELNAEQNEGVIRPGRTRPLTFIYEHRHTTREAFPTDVVIRTSWEMIKLQVKRKGEKSVGSTRGKNLRPRKTRQSRGTATGSGIRFDENVVYLNPSRRQSTVRLCNRTHEQVEIAIAHPPQPFHIPHRRLRMPPRSSVKLPIECNPSSLHHAEHILAAESSDHRSASITLIYHASTDELA